MPSKHPYEILIRFETPSSNRNGSQSSLSSSSYNTSCRFNEANIEKVQKRRSKTGCFNCRKIKKKCSETKPHCVRCQEKGLKCVWPASKNEKLPSDYVIMSDSSATFFAANENNNNNNNKSSSTKEQLPKNTDGLPPREETPEVVETFTNDNDVENNIKEWQYLRILDEFKFQSSMYTTTTTNYNTMIPGTPMSLTSFVNDQSMDFLAGFPDLFTGSKIESLDNNTNYQSLEEYESLPSTPLNSNNSNNLPLVPISTLNTKSQFMYACLHGFITAVAPQYTHPSLTTTATFTAIFNFPNSTSHTTANTSTASSSSTSSNSTNNNNSTMRILEQVAYACGAAFLSWNKEELTSIAFNLYEVAVNDLTVLIEGLTKRDFVQGSGEELVWICGASQMLCLCGKILGKCGEFSLVNLRNTYGVIKARLAEIENDRLKKQKQKSKKNSSSHNSSNAVGDGRNGLAAFDMLNMEIENECLGSQVSIFKDHHYHQSNSSSSSSAGSTRNQFERMFIESYIYNYSTTLITYVSFDKLSQLPTPFQVFKELRTFLKIPIFKCEVPWMNNPVLGAALDAFELIAKTSYLLRQLDNPLTVPMAEKLLDLASYSPSSIIPLEIKTQNEEKYINLKESVIMSDIALKCSKILLLKIIRFNEIQVYSPEIQKEVKSIINKFKSLSRGALVKRIGIWCLFITGLLCINFDERELVVRELVEVSCDTHSRHINQLVKVLRASWNANGTNAISGFSVLWDEEIMESLAL